MLHVRKTVFVILTVLVAVLALPLSANAAITSSGYLSSGLEWSLDANGVLTVKGNGKIPDDERPWAEFYENDGIKSIVIESGVTEIGKGAFAVCSAKTVSLPETVTKLGEDCFAKCFELESVIIPKSVKVIDKRAFQKCYGIKEIILHEGLQEIGDAAFAMNVIEKINIPESVIKIGEHCFAYNSLKRINFSKGVVEIGQGVLAGCNSLEKITVDAENPKYKGVGNCLIEIDSKTLLAACDDCTIPFDGSVTAIGEYVFDNHTKLKSIKLPDSIETIGDCAFRYCESLETVVLPKNLKTIGSAAFFGCEDLQNITVYENVTFIDEHGINRFRNYPLTIYGYNGSYVQKYAEDNGIDFKAISETPITGEGFDWVIVSTIVLLASVGILLVLKSHSKNNSEPC